MKNPEWSYADIRAVDFARAQRLECAGSPDKLIETLVCAFRLAISANEVRFAVDSKHNEFVERRAIIQIPVDPLIYDWFFNSHAGYRGQFWLAPEIGSAFNFRIIVALVEEVKLALPDTISARRIEVTTQNACREELDTGIIEIGRAELIRSLTPEISKIWICERLYLGDKGRIDPIGFAKLSDAARSKAKLRVPNWSEEGLRAPLPLSEHAWLDVKGGFTNYTSAPTQIKPHDDRAATIHALGWT